MTASAPARLRYYLNDGKQNPELNQPTLAQQVHAYYTHWVQKNYHQRDFVVALEHEASMVYINSLFAGEFDPAEVLPAYVPLPLATPRATPALTPATRFYDETDSISREIDTTLCESFLPYEFCLWLQKGALDRDFVQAVRDAAAVEVYNHHLAQSFGGLGGGKTGAQFLASPLSKADCE